MKNGAVKCDNLTTAAAARRSCPGCSGNGSVLNALGLQKGAEACREKKGGSCSTGHAKAARTACYGRSSVFRTNFGSDCGGDNPIPIGSPFAFAFPIHLFAVRPARGIVDRAERTMFLDLELGWGMICDMI